MQLGFCTFSFYYALFYLDLRMFYFQVLHMLLIVSMLDLGYS